MKNGVELSMRLYIIYSIGAFCDDMDEYVIYMRLIESLDNKDSILYRTLLPAIRKLENGEKKI